jgi:hypothetical protein
MNDIDDKQAFTFCVFLFTFYPLHPLYTDPFLGGILACYLLLNVMVCRWWWWWPASVGFTDVLEFILMTFWGLITAAYLVAFFYFEWMES